mmetsp:Transcript_40999/g.46575  ORF Transcript_40999/g.46575 Transcript_40999/m.46575 type:complete len:222 (+) Transcript_40999:114-779(+)|eukprot:CAMPEP_0194134838 /NCGR_PEP_ID=MMETSP0152-20130528/4905_1 /TAXON_ID=1049557 /ORGANISM="Thalassiothrix antarctica, Strain L6-D1" /LENGTH=221 /DNA_ID=CAMNT_0038830751 /DNA_START=40 /DNA_END=708 /DNA_ORIENTATION=-
MTRQQSQSQSILLREVAKTSRPAKNDANSSIWSERSFASTDDPSKLSSCKHKSFTENESILSVELQWEEAVKALALNDYKKALHWCQLAADNSHPAALGQLAHMHLKGLGGLNRSSKKAVDYFKQASDLGHTNSMLKLGNLYEDGVGCKTNYHEAARLYRLLANSSNSEALFCLGNLYMMGDGVFRSERYAFILWEQAAKLGHKTARSFLSLRDLTFQEFP